MTGAGYENGRAGQVGAPADAREKSSGEFKSATLSNPAAVERHVGPSFPEPPALRGQPDDRLQMA